MKALTLANKDFGVAILPTFIEARDAVLAEAVKIIEVEDELDQHECAEALKALATIDKAVEDSRVAVKAPVLDQGREIDRLAAAAVAEVKAEKSRLNTLLTTFTVKQREAAAAAERARQAEIQRLKAEQERREREEREQAAAAAKAAEDARKAAEAEFLAEPDDQKAKAEAAEAKRKADEESAKAEQSKRDRAAAEAARLQSMVSTRPIVAPKIQGISTREELDYRVTDMAALYAARPDLCKVEDRRSDILKALKAGATIPGVESFKVAKTNVKA